MADARPYEERLDDLRKELVVLCTKYEIEIIASLLPLPTAIQAVIKFIDLRNPELLEKYGLKAIKQNEEPEATQNPLRN